MKPDQRLYLLPKPPWVIYLDKLATGNKEQCHLYPPSPWPLLHTHIFHSPFPNLFCLFSPYTTRPNKTKSRTVCSNHVIKWISITAQAPISSDHKLTLGEKVWFVTQKENKLCTLELHWNLAFLFIL